MNDKGKHRVVRMIRAFCRQYGVHAALAEQVKEDTASLAGKLGYSSEQLVGAFSLEREEDRKAIELRRSFIESAEERGKSAAGSRRRWNELLREIAPGRLKMCILFNLIEQYGAIIRRLPECRIEELDSILSVHIDKLAVMRRLRNGIMHVPHVNPDVRENRLFEEAGELSRFFQEIEVHIHNFFKKVVDALFVLRNEPERP